RQIGRVLEKLGAMGELDNTFILFTSDHGIAVGRHGLMGKQNLYEHSWRVPMIVVGPGIEPGSRAPGNVYLLDILATICDFAGVQPPQTNEGKSFAPVAWGEKQVVRDVMYGVYSGGTKPGMRSVRKGGWKLVKIDAYDGKLRKTQLFNLNDNPEELVIEHHDPVVIKKTGNVPKPNQRDLANDPAYAEIRAEMEAELFKVMRTYSDPYRLWDQVE
ncbi:MAG: sulfatase-like hydrolase/transferase, partial [Planctomycetota bacterium]